MRFRHSSMCVCLTSFTTLFSSPTTTPIQKTPTGLRFVLNTDNAMAGEMRAHLRHIYAGGCHSHCDVMQCGICGCILNRITPFV